MQIKKNKAVSLTYQLKVEDEVIDSAVAANPLQFIFGTGMLLPKFEANIEGLKVGDTFEFTLSPEDGYGEESQDALLEFPLETFLVNGELEEDLLIVGNIIPMQDERGNKLAGSVKELREDSVLLDFNHPLAGATLNFSGTVLEMRDATEHELEKGHVCHHHDHDHASEDEGCGCGCHH